MGEPITVYDAHGNEIVMHGQSTVAAQIAAGVVFTTPPPVEPERVEVVEDSTVTPAPEPPVKVVKRPRGKA